MHTHILVGTQHAGVFLLAAADLLHSKTNGALLVGVSIDPHSLGPASTKLKLMSLMFLHQ